MDLEEIRLQLETLHLASFAWARRCCYGNQDEAAEVLQNAYLKVLSGKARFDGKAAFQTWFFGVIRYTAMERYRSRRRRREGLEQFREEVNLPVHETAVDPRVEKILQLTNSLPRRQQEAIHLICRESMTVEEAAAVMKVSVGTARQHYHRAKQKIREQLKEGSSDE